jgi:dTDP-glucose 4,6-dehydratase
MSGRFGQVLVTGGAGFLGSHLCEELVRRGADVTCVDNFLTGEPGNLAGLLGHDRFRLVRADVSERLDHDGPLDLVLHMASPASPVDYLRYPVSTMRAGGPGTLNCLELARRKSARFVLTSTSEVYGDPLCHPQPETYWGNVNPIGPRSVYDEAKRYAEALTMAYRAEYGLNVGIVRVFNTYGPRLRPHDGRMVSTFARQALCAEPLTIAGDGRQTRSLCYVDDTVRGILAVAATEYDQPVNIGNPVELTVKDIALRIRALAGGESEIRHTNAAVDDPRRRCPDITVAREVAGWEPEVDVDDGLVRTIDWLRAVLGRGLGVASLGS